MKYLIYDLLVITHVPLVCVKAVNTPRSIACICAAVCVSLSMTMYKKRKVVINCIALCTHTPFLRIYLVVCLFVLFIPNVSFESIHNLLACSLQHQYVHVVYFLFTLYSESKSLKHITETQILSENLYETEIIQTRTAHAHKQRLHELMP